MKKKFVVETDGSFFEDHELKRMMMADELTSILWDLCEDDGTPENIREFVKKGCYERGINIHVLES